MGRTPSDWTVRNIGGEGTVRCAGHYGRFRVRRDGVVKIIWQLGKGPGPEDSGPVNQAALEAIAAALWPQSTGSGLRRPRPEQNPSE